jgi:IS4 transposase
VPVRNDDPGWDVVRRLLLLARRLVRIDGVLLDREFYDSEVYGMIEDMGLEFIGHVRKSKGMGRLYYEAIQMGERNASYMINAALSKKYEIELYFKDGDEEDDYDYMVLTSNKLVEPLDIDLLFDAYASRWNIENTYCEALQFKARTNTVQHAYRLILFVLSHLIANLLMIMRIVVKQVTNIRFSRSNMKKMLKRLAEGVTGSLNIGIHFKINFK